MTEPVKYLRKEVRSTQFIFKVSPSELQRIRERAKAAQMSVGSYLIAAALGEDVVAQSDLEDRLDAQDRRLDRLERMADLGGFE